MTLFRGIEQWLEQRAGSCFCDSCLGAGLTAPPGKIATATKQLSACQGFDKSYGRCDECGALRQVSRAQPDFAGSTPSPVPGSRRRRAEESLIRKIWNYEQKAEEIRATAEITADPTCQAFLYRLADDYERLAYNLTRMSSRNETAQSANLQRKPPRSA